jgi:hypothetical protein
MWQAASINIGHILRDPVDRSTIQRQAGTEEDEGAGFLMAEPGHKKAQIQTDPYSSDFLFG